jgi:hypothetical protein
MRILMEASYELKFELQVQVMRLISGAHSILDCQAYMPVHTTPNLTHVSSMVQMYSHSRPSGGPALSI